MHKAFMNNSNDIYLYRPAGVLLQHWLPGPLQRKFHCSIQSSHVVPIPQPADFAARACGREAAALDVGSSLVAYFYATLCAAAVAPRPPVVPDLVSAQRALLRRVVLVAEVRLGLQNRFRSVNCFLGPEMNTAKRDSLNATLIHSFKPTPLVVQLQCIALQSSQFNSAERSRILYRSQRIVEASHREGGHRCCHQSLGRHGHVAPVGAAEADVAQDEGELPAVPVAVAKSDVAHHFLEGPLPTELRGEPAPSVARPQLVLQLRRQALDLPCQMRSDGVDLEAVACWPALQLPAKHTCISRNS